MQEMTLKDYRIAHKIERSDFAALVGVDYMKIYRLEEQGQIPDKKLGRKIYKTTEHVVPPNTFYGIINNTCKKTRNGKRSRKGK